MRHQEDRRISQRSCRFLQSLSVPDIKDGRIDQYRTFVSECAPDCLMFLFYCGRTTFRQPVYPVVIVDAKCLR